MKLDNKTLVDENEKNLFLKDGHSEFKIDSCFTYNLSDQLLIDLKKMSNHSVQGRILILSSIIKVLLYRYTGHSTIPIGIPSIDRTRDNIYTITTEKISILSFKDLILSVQQELNQAISRNQKDIKSPSVIVTHELIHKKFVSNGNTDIMFSFEEIEEDLLLHVHYSSSLFTEEFIKQVTGHVQTLSHSLLNNPGELLSTVQFLDENEIFHLTQELYNTHKDLDNNLLIHQQFERQAAITPDKIAVIFQAETFSYKYINEESNKLAHYLKDNYSISKDNPIGLLMDRTEKTIITILAILKSGGCYIPMDKMYPEDRIIDIIDDCKMKVLITEKDYASTELLQRIPLLILEDTIMEIDQYSIENPVIQTKISDLAYIIFTSGSTGKPKGVMIEHQNVINLVTHMNELLPNIAEEVGLAVNSFSFDISVIDLFFCLSNGMTIVVHPHDEIQYENYDRYLSLGQPITFLQTTPSRLKLLIGDTNSTKFLQSLQMIMMSGENVPTEIIKNLRKLTKAKIFNMYGPTETTVWSIGTEIHEKMNLVPAGLPVLNTPIYILDHNLQLVPKGGIGELYIGGKGVSRGYINREELTTERFIQNPFLNKTDCIYKSGDLVRILPDNTLFIIGRMDSQIKLNGYRIELEEVESVLKNHENVSDAYVLIQQESDKEKLVAYIKFTDNSIKENEVREFLKKKLPSYMIPHKLLKLNSIPLTTNGKLDTKSLHYYSEELNKENKNMVFPRNKIEEELHLIFKDTLEIENISVHDNFFDIGGHSLMALKIVGILQERLDKEISLGDFFTTPTISGIAENLSKSELNKVVRRYNVDFSPDSYYYFFPCIYAAVIEKMKHELKIKVKKSFIPAIEGYPLLGYSYALNSTERAEGLDYMAPIFGKFADFKSNEERFDIQTTNHSFDSLGKAINWCEEQLSKGRLIVATVNTYYLHYTSDYMLDPDHCLEKFNDKYKRNEPFLSHALILVDITEEGFVVFDSNFNYFGLVPKEDFHNAFMNLKGLPFLKDHPAYLNSVPYSVADIDVSRIEFNESQIAEEIFAKLITGYFREDKISHVHEGIEARAFIGLRAINELISVLQEYNDPTYHKDVRFLILKLFFVWNHTFLFLHDFLQDVSITYPVSPNDLKNLLNISNQCKEWSLNIENVTSSEFEEYINKMVLELKQSSQMISIMFNRLKEKTHYMQLQE
ncbi:non-ribosomal peptide synthetase [Fictibacillus nanhaiensis]|uniref:non-ribosomal peptide synthetase n=1 Tax=Fictibacillus nanhaiensis TaxID=742169 RepID=UPI003C19131D